MQADLWTGPHHIPETQLISADLYFNRSLHLNHPETKTTSNSFFTKHLNFSTTDYKMLLKSDVIPTPPLCLKSINTDAIFWAHFQGCLSPCFPTLQS